MSNDISKDFLDGFFYSENGSAKPLDIDFFYGLMIENNIDFEDILDDVRDMGLKDSKDMNIYIYALLERELGELKEDIIKIGTKYIKDFDYTIVQDYEVSIYTNFLDSGYDDNFFMYLSKEDITEDWVTNFYNAIK